MANKNSYVNKGLFFHFCFHKFYLCVAYNSSCDDYILKACEISICVLKKRSLLSACSVFFTCLCFFKVISHSLADYGKIFNLSVMCACAQLNGLCAWAHKFFFIQPVSFLLSDSFQPFSLLLDLPYKRGFVYFFNTLT
jgi:hypothetical protein